MTRAAAGHPDSVPSAFRIEESAAVLADYLRIEDWLHEMTGDPALAERIVDQIRARIFTLRDVPLQGTCRDDLLEGLRLIPARGKAIIAFRVDQAEALVRVLRVFYAGEDHETIMRGYEPR